jgi:hypothetical protein
MAPPSQFVVTPPSQDLWAQLDLPVSLPTPSPSVSLTSCHPLKTLPQSQGIVKKKKVTGQRVRRAGKVQGKREAI